MKLHSKLAIGLIASVLSVGVASADHHGGMMKGHGGMDCDGMGMMHGKMMDPTAMATQHLAELKADLKITKDQEPAWQTFSGKVNAQAKDMAAMRDKMKMNQPKMPMTAPERMEMMSGMMKNRAEMMANMADAVKTFYATLTPEQKAKFDKMHMKHMQSAGGMMMK
jgi:hypothetical protein